jgi:hypothetical protein
MHESDVVCGVPIAQPPDQLMDVIGQHPNTKSLNPSDVMCDQGYCDPVREGMLLYRDSGHLNDDGARWLGQKWFERGERL